MSNSLDRLRQDEAQACRIAARVLGAKVTPWDVDKRQGAVEAMLTLPDGRQAAFEVTALDADSGLQLDALLAREPVWPSPGKWVWSVWVGHPADLPRLRDCFPRLARLCEAAGVTQPEDLRQTCDDPDLMWLINDSSSSLVGLPQVPAVDGEIVRHTMITSSGQCDMADGTLAGLRDALAEAFKLPHMSKRLDKLAKAEADERHLFVIVHPSALPFAVMDDLCVGTALPPHPAPLPDSATYLWLAPPFGRRILLWTPEGWQQHYLDHD